MRHGKSKRSFALFNLVTTIIEEGILISLLLWLLPWLGISMPTWLIVVLALAWAAWSYLTYSLGKRVFGQSPAVGPEAMVGTICQTTTSLCPVGYV